MNRRFPVVLDLETKHTFREFSEPKQLGITVLSLYDYAKQKNIVVTEKELPQIYPILENASYVIGYNIISFDLAVLQGYYPGDVTQFHAFDLMDDIRNKIGRRLALNDLIAVTLEKKKTGHGLMAIDYYKEGKWDELKQYCADDVMVTKELFEYGVRNREVFYRNEVGKVRVAVDWKKYLEEDQTAFDTALTLPF